MLIHSDCLEALRNLPDNSVDSVVTDPPYGLSFMGKKWDYDVPSVDIWQECLRVLKPGGHLLSFAGSRTYHRITCAIEDAGFEIRDQIMWVYGSGFPKSLNIGKAIDKMWGAEREIVGQTDRGTGRQFADGCSGFANGVVNITAPATPEAKQWDGWGTALKPAHEPICVARKPISEPSIAANVLKWGTGAINIDGCRVGTKEISVHYNPQSNYSFYTATISGNKSETDMSLTAYRSHQGRFPANFIHDGSDEATAGLGDAQRYFYCAKASKAERNMGCEGLDKQEGQGSYKFRTDGSLDGKPTAAKSNIHPTVKPIALMRYLIKLVTPPDGVVLDPFLGSGTTAIAAVLEGRDWIGIEREAEYCDIARARIAAAEPQQIEVAL